MRRRWIVALFIVVAVIVAGLALITIIAPESSPINLFVVRDERLPCLLDEEEACLVMPGITGLRANSSPVTFPDEFDTDYQLVVMPLDRDQNTHAVTWLPHLRDLASEQENVTFWSVSPLPDLNAALRILIMGGMTTSMRDDTLYPHATMFFLEDQQLFLDALAIDNIEQIQLFVMDRNGVVYHREAGEYTPESLDALRNMMVLLPDELAQDES